jgi:hypothetical protein
MSKRATLISAVVAAAVVAAIFGAAAALRLIGGPFGPGGRPLSESDVRKAFSAASRTPTASPSQAGQSPSRSPHPSATAGARKGTFSSAGGSALASCASGNATLTRWIPAPGYGVDGFVQGPARTAWVKFKADGSEITVTVTCLAGKPHFTTSADDRGGGHGGGGGSNGSGGGSGGH